MGHRPLRNTSDPNYQIDHNRRRIEMLERRYKVAPLLDYAWISWDYQTNGFDSFDAADGVPYGWSELPTDGWSAYTTDPSVFLPFVLDIEPADGAPESVSLIHQTEFDSPSKLIHTYGWCSWDVDASPWNAFWEYFSGSPEPANAPIYKQLGSEPPDHFHDGLTCIASGESGAIVGGFYQNSGSTKALNSIGIYAVRFADHTGSGTFYPPFEGVVP